jgi:chromate reductase, NAD(P)H dehydrogenase (quinone)
MKVLGISGSLREGSHNTQLLGVAARALPVDAEYERWAGLAELPVYNQDIDVPGALDAAAAGLRAAIDAADAVLFVTPEYNGSIPGGLKNAVDWASRPVGDAALKGKPVAVIGASTGQFGGVWAQAELRKSLGIAGARVVDAEFAVGKAADAFDERGELIDPEMSPRLAELLETLIEQARINAAARAEQYEQVLADAA